nr:hypothetical protein [Tanacetum cinerariifolium]
MNYVPVIVGTTSNYFAEKGTSFDADSDGDNMENDGPNTKSEIDNQDRPNVEHSTKDINIIGPSINTTNSNINTASPTVNTVRLSDDFFGADNDMRSLDRVELDISNISTPYPVPATPNTRINKYYSLDNDSLFIRWTLRVLSCMEGLKKRFMCVNLQGLKTLNILIKFKKWRKLSMVYIKLQEPGDAHHIWLSLILDKKMIKYELSNGLTLNNGEIELNATVDGQVKTITEASVRRHLKLADADVISTLPTTEIFEQLALMGYVIDSDELTFQKDMLPLPCSTAKLEAVVVALPNPSCISLLMASSAALDGTLD